MPRDGPPLPSIAVSVLAYHSAATSPTCLRSVLTAEYDGELEILVREQGGDDAEHAALKMVANEASVPVNVERGANLGFCGGHNRAFRRSSGALFLVLNADARLEKGYFRAVVDAFSEPSVGAAQALVLREGSSGVEIDATGLEPHRSRRIVARSQGATYQPPLDAAEVWGVDGAVAVYRRAALDDVAHPGREVFDEAFFAYKEDVDLAWRLRRRGWSSRFVPDAVAWHDRGARGSAAVTIRTLFSERRAVSDLAFERGFVNQRLAQVKNEQWHSLRTALAPWLAREAVTWLLVVSRWKGLGRIIFGLLRGLPRAVRRRLWVQQRLLVNDDQRWFR